MSTHLEYFAFSGWPATHTDELDGWVIRRAGGYTKRANSINILSSSTDQFDEKYQQVIQLFEQDGLIPIFRIPSIANADKVDHLLAAKGYQKKETSLVMCKSINAPSGPDTSTFTIIEEPVDLWLKHFAAASEQPTKNNPAHLGILNAIKDATCFLTLYLDDQPVASALGVVSDDHMGLFELVTRSDYRGRGLATTLIHTLENWAQKLGATTSYLQVLATNATAIKLYSTLGFKERYSYWYRIK